MAWGQSSEKCPGSFPPTRTPPGQGAESDNHHQVLLTLGQTSHRQQHSAGEMRLTMGFDRDQQLFAALPEVYQGETANCKCQTPGKLFLCSWFSLGSGKNFPYKMGYSFSRTFSFCTTSLSKFFILDLSEFSPAFLIWFWSIFLCLYSRISYLADGNRKAFIYSKGHLLHGLLISCWTYNKDKNSVLIQCAELKPCRPKP